MSNDDVLLCNDSYVPGVIMRLYYGPVHVLAYSDDLPKDNEIEHLCDLLRIAAKVINKRCDAVVGLAFEVDPYQGWWRVTGTAAEIA